jgi:hypothetical protein
MLRTVSQTERQILCVLSHSQNLVLKMNNSMPSESGDHWGEGQKGTMKEQWIWSEYLIPWMKTELRNLLKLFSEAGGGW